MCEHIGSLGGRIEGEEHHRRSAPDRAQMVVLRHEDAIDPPREEDHYLFRGSY